MRHILTAALLASALGMGACGPINRGLESVNQPVVSRADYALDVSANALGYGSGAEERRIDGWFDALHLSYGDHVTIDDPSPGANSAAREAVARLLAQRGLLLGEESPTTPGQIAPGTVRIVVSRSSAEVHNCPNWDRISQPEFASSTMSNFGCAVNANLAAMVANPQDLVRGQSNAGGADARSVNKAVKAYRDAQPTASGGLKTESTKNGGQ